MRRKIESALKDWKEKENRKPLIVRGARQVGKSFTISAFGRENFEYFHTVNFERTPQVQSFFKTDLDPKRILKELGFFYQSEIIPGKSLLFFDEIQECPRAIMALRYFYEEMPDLHVIGAGSLIEFALRAEDFRMPVGRIDYLWMRPLSFGEFLDAKGEEKLHQAISELEIGHSLNGALHERALRSFREYACVGGMPEAVEVFIRKNSLTAMKDVQESLLKTFRDDFGKYASRSQHKYLDRVFWNAPKSIGQKLKFSRLDPEMKSRDLRQALDLLVQAGLFYLVKHTSARGLPLEAGASEQKFKVVFLDIGLMQRGLGLDSVVYFETEDLTHVHQGAVAEQLVGQELLAYGDFKTEGRLYFWTREERNSSAEVDYLFPAGDRVLPVEVKSVSAGRLKSMRLFMKERSSQIGVRLSALPLSFHDQILSVPIFAVERLRPLIESCLQ